MNSQEPFLLGPWRVDPALNQIQSEGAPIRVEPKVMAVITLLAESSPEVVPRDTLVAHVWQGLNVSAGSLKHLIWETRRVLGDDAAQPKFIETIPRVGYRLVATLKPIPQKTMSRRPLLIAAMALTMAVGLALFWYAGKDPGPPAIATDTRLATQSVTSFPGLEVEPAMSPNGKLVAYGRRPQGKPYFAIWVQDIHSGETQQITDGSASDKYPVWSPDGERLAFLRSNPKQGAGIHTVTLTTREMTTVLGPESGVLGQFDWAPNGKRLAVSIQSADARPHIALVPLTDGPVIHLSNPPMNSTGDFNPVFSGDGSRIAFNRGSGRWTGDVFVISLKDGVTHRLTHDNATLDGLTWLGGQVVFSSDRIPPRGLWRIDADTAGQPQWLPVTARHAHKPTIARNNQSLIYQEVACNPNLWTFAKGQAVPFHSNTSTTVPEFAPSFSPSGKRLAYISGGADSSVKIMDLDQGAITDHQGPPGAYTALAWSPDGNHIVFDARNEGRTGIWILDLKSGGFHAPFANPDDRLAPSWNADGSALYFTSARDGSFHIWKQGLDEAQPQRVTPAGGWVGKEAWHSGRFYFTKRDKAGIWQLNEDQTGETQIVTHPGPANGFDWAISDSGLYYVQETGYQHSLKHYDLATQTIQDQGRISMLSPYAGLTVSADGSQVVYGRVENFESDLFMSNLAQ